MCVTEIILIIAEVKRSSFFVKSFRRCFSGKFKKDYNCKEDMMLIFIYDIDLKRNEKFDTQKKLN